MHKCPDCSREFEKLFSLSVHWRKSHKKTSRELYTILFCNGTEPTCACGCGAELKFVSIMKGFTKYRCGHIQRVKNSWGHNPKANKKSHETRRRLLKEGKIQVWNKGLTKESDERVRKYGKERSKKFTNEERIQKSKTLSRLWNEGIFIPLKGEDHSQWKGGHSRLQAICRFGHPRGRVPLPS